MSQIKLATKRKDIHGMGFFAFAFVLGFCFFFVFCSRKLTQALHSRKMKQVLLGEEGEEVWEMEEVEEIVEGDSDDEDSDDDTDDIYDEEEDEDEVEVFSSFLFFLFFFGKYF